jgi:hypothetical protein
MKHLIFACLLLSTVAFSQDEKNLEDLNKEAIVKVLVCENFIYKRGRILNYIEEIHKNNPDLDLSKESLVRRLLKCQSFIFHSEDSSDWFVYVNKYDDRSALDRYSYI